MSEARIGDEDCGRKKGWYESAAPFGVFISLEEESYKTLLFCGIIFLWLTGSKQLAAEM